MALPITTWEERLAEQELLDHSGDPRPSETEEYTYAIADDADPVYIEPDAIAGLGWTTRLPAPFALLIDTGGGDFDISMGCAQQWPALGIEAMEYPELRALHLKGSVQKDDKHGWWVVSFSYMWWDTNFLG
ncbi:hypothetical protein [Luteibacter sp. 9135]|uniref:hypothetical protein n=1 Tax=Luteibacter sp. 9135 TaxID=1500893 RepID=UPI0005607C09|nr:hypothetical protein [Luteibacter sp. 9135]